MAHFLILARHGETALNDTPGHSGTLRGQLNVPLDAGGIMGTYKLGAYFKDKPVQEVFSGPLDRDRQTAEQIAAPHSLVVHVRTELGPWNMGHLAGTPTEGGTRELQRLSEKAPDEPAGQIGESFNQFLQRWNRGFAGLMHRALSHHGITIGVTHGRNIQTAKAHITGNKGYLKWGHKETAPGGLAVFQHPGTPGGKWSMVPGDPLTPDRPEKGE